MWPAGRTLCTTVLAYIDMLTALPDATNDLTLPCHEKRAGAATATHARSRLRHCPAESIIRWSRSFQACMIRLRRSSTSRTFVLYTISCMHPIPYNRRDSDLGC